MILESELILNNDGTIFHLHLKPEHLAEKIILVGDQNRVDVISTLFDSIEYTVQNREFRTVTGTFKGTRLTVVSTGIGTDNIDIVLNELDALVNIDLEKRTIKPVRKQLQIVRIGTSGALQDELPVNSFVVSQKSMGFDGMLSFYANRELVCDLPFEEAFKQYTGWKNTLPTPYVVDASNLLLSKFTNKNFIKGVTISTPGFYGPQGRELRLPLAMPELNRLIKSFNYNGFKIANYEMESSAIYALSKMLGHEALTVCMLINNRQVGKANENYYPYMKKLTEQVLNCLIQ